MELTPEQREAIERRDRGVFLQAGAGSGKTRVLVERFVQAVVTDGVAVDRILAITFTEKAAGELKARIRARFLELGEREHARAAEAAWVSTIHGFCARLLRTHALAAGLDPEFRILDEAEAGRIALDAFDRALEEFLATGDEGDRLELVASYTPDKLERMVRTVHSRLRSRGERRPELPEREPPRPAGEAERLRAAAVEALRELGGASGAMVERAVERLEDCAAALDALGDGRVGDPSAVEKLNVPRGNAKALATPALDEYDEALAAYLALCRGLKGHRDYVLLRALLARYGARYEELKEARSGLDFEDLELMARDLLAGDAALRDSYRERFAHVLVDEFQDTNTLQDSILELVSRREENLFTVGDERQSIYLFRNADVGVFERARAAAAERGQVAGLTVNFRSRAEVLDVVGSAFAREELFGAGFQRLEPAERPAEERAVSVPSAELLVVDSGRGCWEELGDDPFGAASLRVEAVWRAAEARLLAGRVRELVDAGACRPGDVAVLLRAASDILAYERALAERGLPTYVVGARGYFGQQQVADLRAWLAVLANPLDELSLYSALASPLVGASLDAVVTVGRRARAARRGVWWALESAFADGGDGCEGLAEALAEEDRRSVAAFVELLSAEREAAPRRSLETLIDRAVTATGYDRTILAMPDGDRRMANVRKLMRLAREYERDEGRDLRGFIDFVDERELVQVREGEAPLEAEGLDAVRIMTIHAAKGLEFPVVCVSDLGRRGTGDDSALRITDDGRVGLEIASLGGGSAAALDLERIKAEQKELEEAEERRVFYVGMTRAERHLIVSGATDLDKLPEPKPLDVPMNWAWRALAPGGLRAALEAGGEAEWAEGGARVRVVALTAATADAVLPQAERGPAAAPAPAAAGTRAAEPRAAEPAAGAPAGPDHAAATPAAAAPPAFAQVEVSPPLPVSRLSYSGLERFRSCGYRFYLERILRLAEPVEAPRLPEAARPAEGAPADGDLSPLLRGTVVHELLERLDFARPVRPSDEEVAAALAAHGVAVPAAEVAAVGALVEAFGASELCRRIAAAGRARREVPFAYTLAPDGAGRSLLVTGFLDVLCEEPGGALVVDYKTDALEGRDPAAVCEEHYATQRLVYALGALRAGFERVDVVHCFLERPDEPAAASFGVDDARPLETDLLALAADLVAGRFVPSGEPHAELCRTCPGRLALCLHDDALTLRSLP